MNITLLLKQAQQAKRKSGKSILAQIYEILQLQKSTGQIGLSEYYDYHLYDEKKYNESSKQEFVGWKSESLINNQFNKSEWAAFSFDKIIFYTFLEGAGVPYPSIQGILSTNGRFLKNVPTFDTAESLAQYLKTDAVYPIFAKPSHGNFGRGSFYLSQYDASNDSIVFRDGTKSPLLEFTKGLETKLSGGYIFQNVFPPHPALVEICGSRSSTMRIVVVINKSGPQLLHAVWKIPTGNNVIDNFQHGKNGNLVASVRVNDGEIERVIGSGGSGGKDEFIEVTNHPDTGKPLYPFVIPNWTEIKALCLRAACIIPGYRLLHFDIALAENGPSLLEVNIRGNMDLIQHASGRGFMSQELSTALNDQEAFRKEIAEIVRRNQEQNNIVGA